ncbi:MAG: glycosyltransferase family 2 protein [Calditrichia bacterium]
MFGILIPVYNADQLLPELLNGIAEAQADCRNTFCVQIVDDGSEPELMSHVHPDLEVVQIRHDGNRGKGAALKSGIRELLNDKKIEAVITLDADLQHPPEYIPAFIDIFESRQVDLVIGRRRRDPKIMPPHRMASNYLTSRIVSWIGGQRVEDSQCGFRLYSRRLLETVHPKEDRFHLESEFVVRTAWKKYSIGAVDIPTIYNGAPSAIRHVADTLNFVGLMGRLLKEKIRGYV